MIPHDTHLQIGSLLFEGLDQIDLTGPFEVLSRIPNSTYRLYGKTAEPVRDLKGLRLTPDSALSDAPPLDVLHVLGGFGQEALMEDTEVLAWIRQQAVGGRVAFSRYDLDDGDVNRFLAAGFSKDQLLEVIAAVAASTITNYTGSITKAPLEAPFQAHVWAG